ncbi:hypothetical protein [Sphingopyxis panaciterrae]
MNGWWFAAACVGLYLLLWAFMARKSKLRALALAARRPNPNRQEFVTLLAGDCDADVAAFLWDELADNRTPDLTPHPDDDYLGDLSVDPDEQGDWVKAFCDAHRLRIEDWPDWPDGQATTVREFARWLSDGRRSLTGAIAA